MPRFSLPLNRLMIGLMFGLACDSAPEPAPAPAPSAPAAPVPVRITTVEGLSGVCDGTGVESVAAYEKQPGKLSPVAYFYKDTTFPADAGAFKLVRPHELSPWASKAVDETELVACLTVTESNKARDCEFNAGSTLELYSWTATLAIHEARTGKKIDEQVISHDATDRGCPATAMMAATVQRDYGPLPTEVTRGIAVHQPPDVPPPNLAASTFEAACDGKPALGAGKMTTAPGGSNPFVVFLREGDEAWRYGVPNHYSFDMKWFEPNLQALHGLDDDRVSLVLCATTTRTTKVRNCNFSAGAKLKVVAAKWKIDVVEAATGTVIGTKEFDSAYKCPEVWSFARGSEWVSEPGPALVEWLSTMVEPT